MIRWITVNDSLTLSHDFNGTEYRVRERADGAALLIAEGRINKREVCRSRTAAFARAEDWAL